MIACSRCVWLVAEHVSCTSAEPFTSDELRQCLNTFKQGKSAGEDGIPYEFLHVVSQTNLVHAFLQEMISILDGSRPVPPTRFEGRCLQTARAQGSSSSRFDSHNGKLKMLRNRMREQHAFPAIKAGQLCAQPGCQSLDGSLAMQSLVHVSNKWLHVNLISRRRSTRCIIVALPAVSRLVSLCGKFGCCSTLSAMELCIRLWGTALGLSPSIKALCKGLRIAQTFLPEFLMLTCMFCLNGGIRNSSPPG